MKGENIRGKTFVITGASGGLGFNIAKRLIENYDCKVIGVARNEQKILNAKDTLNKNKDNFTYKIFDVTQKDEWGCFLGYLKSQNICPDALINNAGFMLPFLRFCDIPDSEIESIIDTNFKGVLYGVKTLLPYMLEKEYPSSRKKSKYDLPLIINVSSAAGLCAVVGESMYCATKYAVRGFTDVLRQDYKGNLSVIGVYPGFIKTDILHKMSVTDKENKLISKLMKPVESATKIIVNGIIRRKKNIVLGYDGRLMSAFGKRFPVLTASAIRSVLKKSKLDFFKDVFED